MAMEAMRVARLIWWRERMVARWSDSWERSEVGHRMASYDSRLNGLVQWTAVR